MDRLLRRGHGPAVYGYGWGWFMRCLRAADAADAAEAVRDRLRRVQTMADFRMAMHGTKDAVENYLNKVVRD